MIFVVRQIKKHLVRQEPGLNNQLIETEYCIQNIHSVLSACFAYRQIQAARGPLSTAKSTTEYSTTPFHCPPPTLSKEVDREKQDAYSRTLHVDINFSISETNLTYSTGLWDLSGF